MRDYLSLEGSYIVLQKEFFDICPDSKSAGIVLSYLYGWHKTNVKHRIQENSENLSAEKEGMEPPHEVNFNESPWIYLEEESICEGLFRLISEKTLRETIKYLTELGFVTARRHPKYKYVSKKQYQLQLHAIQDAIIERTEKLPSPDGNELPTVKLPSYNGKITDPSSNTINKNISHAEFKNSDGKEEIQQPKKRGRPPGKKTQPHEVTPDTEERGPNGGKINPRFELYKVYCECRGDDWNNPVGRDIILKSFTKDFIAAMQPHEVKELYDYVVRSWDRAAAKKGERNMTKPNIIHLKKAHSEWLAWKSHRTKSEQIVKTVSPAPVRNDETVSKAAIEKIARMRLEAEENNRKAKEEWVD